MKHKSGVQVGACRELGGAKHVQLPSRTAWRGSCCLCEVATLRVHGHISGGELGLLWFSGISWWTEELDKEWRRMTS